MKARTAGADLAMNSVRLSRATAVLSGGFAVALVGVGVLFHSQLAFAQAADSTLDFTGALVLAWVVQVAQRPKDEDHPWGHTRAEPLGALGVAMLAAVLAVQVALSAFHALSADNVVVPDRALVLLFAAKVVFKGLIFFVARHSSGPALRALAVDAKNDMLVGLVSVIGYVGLRLGYSSLDSWLSFPVAAWIFWSGVVLARENIDLLMGTAPTLERQRELARLAASVPGVLNAHDLRAHHLGALLSVHVHVQVRAELTVRQGHDIGEAVRLRLEDQEDVADCSVHVDPDDA